MPNVRITQNTTVPVEFVDLELERKRAKASALGVALNTVTDAEGTKVESVSSKSATGLATIVVSVMTP